MNEKEKALTVATAREFLDYDPSTGIFIWLQSRGLARAGNRAGSLEHRGYIVIGINGNRYGAHRLAWLFVHGQWPNQIDHINGVPSDNRISNLRDVSIQENCRNRRMSINNTSGHLGVSWITSKKLWHATISISGRLKSLGYFACKDDAVVVRKAAEVQYCYHPNHGGELIP